MKLTKSVISKYAKLGRDFKAGDLLVVLDKGTFVSSEYMGKPRVQLVFKIRVPSGSELALSVNNTSKNKLIDAYGEDTENWVGKKVKVWQVLQNVGGEMKKVAYLTAPNQNLEDDAEKPIDIGEEEEAPLDEIPI